MELSLPETFEAYSDARKAGFLKVKTAKEGGRRVAGTFCTFTPLEILDAAGMLAVSLCGMSAETIPAAEVDLPRNLCPLIKSSYGFYVSDKCPYTYFSDLIVGETTCDGKKKMYELMARGKELFLLHLPQGVDLPYARDMWRAEVRRLKELIPDIVLTSDVIVGFPGETTEEFEETLSLLEQVRFDALFTFIFSPRVGTPAAQMDDPMPHQQKQANFQRLVDLQNQISAEKHAAYVGKTLRCLIDGDSGDARYPLAARTPGNRLVRLDGPAELIGQFRQVRITDANTWSLFGELAE